MTQKAYIVTDETTELEAVIVFHQHSVAARRIGANNLNVEFSDVSCRRAPEFDGYAIVGRVPNRVLLNHGWWMGCTGCRKTVYGNDCDHPPILRGDDVYCSQKCVQAISDHTKRALAACQALDGTRQAV